MSYPYSQMPPPPPGYSQPNGPPPSDVVIAVRLMFVEAGLSLLGILSVIIAKDQLRTAIRDSNANASASHLDDLVNAAIAITVVVAIVFLVLYLLLALQVRKGKNWARIVTWVLAGLGVLSALGALAQNEATLNKVVSLIGGVIDLVIIVLLARRPAQDYFRKRTY